VVVLSNANCWVAVLPALAYVPVLVRKHALVPLAHGALLCPHRFRKNHGLLVAG
jgi:hypothetical protein